MKKIHKKKAPPRRKALKKRISQQKKPVNPMALAMIPYSEIQKPEVYKGKYTLIPTPFNDLQIRAIIAPTPSQIIKQRPGKGGGSWDYVPGWWFKKKLNFVFGFSHDFDILGERVDGDFITVKGKLTVKNPKTGKEIASKTDYGGAAIKYKKDMVHKPENYLDISNDFKAAATDSLKRCAVQFGFAMDIYGKGESVQEGYQVAENGQGKVLEVKTEHYIAPAPKRPVDAIKTDYKIKLTEYLEDRGQLKDASKIKFIQDRALIKVYNYSEIKPAMAQVILAQLARGEATKK